jgi:hypothetical protein
MTPPFMLAVHVRFAFLERKNAVVTPLRRSL